MILKPILPIWLMVLCLAGGVALLVLTIRRRRMTIAYQARLMIRMILIFVLVFLIGLRPMTEKVDAEVEMKNLDVLFVVDTTMSMWARDVNGSQPRMKSVTRDMEHIMEMLAGGNFGLITFDDFSHVEAPFTQDMSDIRSCMKTFAMPDSYRAQGTSMSTPIGDMESLLLSSSKKENRKTIVFFISDGESTRYNETGLTDSEREGYEKLAQYIDGGAVLGYGTETGGRMRGEYGYVEDPETWEDALSKLDENNLNQIADALGLSYQHMTVSEQIEPMLEKIRASSAMVTANTAGIVSYEDLYYWFAIPLILLLLYELGSFIWRGRL